ncbi:MAG: Coronin-like protein crn1 [Cirrosporium novae-zelandiae]|nr:MAG: Coronin-like protein crn1 [Cirrosporium novae-zelandiae]
MAGRFVRASKYRHVFGRSTKKEQCYDNLRISRNAWDTNLVKANPKYLAVNWEASGGGAFAVIPLDEKGRAPELIPLFRGHTAAVLDTDWNPFNDSLIASGSDDAKVFLWRVPEGFTLQTEPEHDPVDVAPVGKLAGHQRKVGHVLFNPAAENVLASSSADHTVKIWDIEAGSTKLNLHHNDIVQSLSWSADGSMLVTTSRDKKLRVWDVRSEKPAFEVPGHAGAKNSRAVWMGEHDRIATTGFSKMSDRQLALWDIHKPNEPVGGFQILDSISGVCMPFWDDGTQCLYLAGKGDGNIRYFEYENDKFEFLSEYKSSDPQRGLAFVPKRGVNVHENEVLRAYKTVNDTYVEPISFIVPRRAEVFQGDIYPPTTGSKPAMGASDWFSGKTSLPPKINLESVYEGHEPEEVPGGQVKRVSPPPAAQSAPSPTKKEPEPSPVIRSPPPTMKEQQGSIANIAAKYADKEDADEKEVNDDSSFEEVSKPSEKFVTLPSTRYHEDKPPSPKKAEPAPISPIKASPPEEKPWPTKILSPTTSVPQTSSTSAATNIEPIQGYLQDIKAVLEQQNKVMANQSQMIEKLTNEVNTLKVQVESGKNKGM